MQQSLPDLIAQGLAASLTLRVLVAAFSAIALHEFGHILFARLSGVPIERVVIGEGRRLLGWRMGGIGFAIHAVPISGYVEHAAYGATPRRTLALAAGGIVVNLAAGVSCLAVYLLGGAGGMAPLVLAIALAHLALAALSIVPRRFEDGNRSDGLLMLEAWRALGSAR